MAINQFQAKFRAASPIPVVALSGHTVNGGLWVKSSGGKDANGVIQVVVCGAGDRALGSTEYDCDVSNNMRSSCTRPGDVVRSVPGGTITAGDAIQSDSLGRSITLASAVAAALATGVVGSNNAVTWTARAPGVGGNSVTVTLVDPGGTAATLSVDVAENGHDITVNLGRASSAINTTAQALMDAVEANGDANSLVTVASTSTSNGTGLVAAVSKTSLAGGTDPEGGGHVLGTAQTSVTVSDTFVEVASN